MFKQEMTKESLNKSKNDLLLKAISKYDITGREEEIILLIAKGLRQKEIADQLFISEATVKKHLSNIYVKLNVQSSIDALNKLNLKQQ
jgi:DNA-binding NarL/FixJ family response regulator